jgi:hypothetical protein
MTATAYKEPSDMTPLELILRFEYEIAGDHDLGAHFEKSEARKELQSRGAVVLRHLINHLQLHPPSDYMNLDMAWGRLLSTIAIKMGEINSCPDTTTNTQAWIDWFNKRTSFQ